LFSNSSWRVGSDSDLLQRHPTQFICLVYREWIGETDFCQNILSKSDFGLRPPMPGEVYKALAELPTLSRPTHIVLYDSMLNELQRVLELPALQLRAGVSFHHSHFNTDADDPNTERRIHVLERAHFDGRKDGEAWAKGDGGGAYARLASVEGMYGRSKQGGRDRGDPGRDRVKEGPTGL
jgi:hypothetical protein